MARMLMPSTQGKHPLVRYSPWKRGYNSSARSLYTDASYVLSSSFVIVGLNY
jgi:hypothetical protein